jgi:pSer/pThr/pTyr-binding forkhead associated (FHA) protein
MAALYQIRLDGTLGSCWVLEQASIVVGRGELADIQIDDKTLSRSHFLISREGADYFLIDLDSQNGTWLDGRRVKGAKLHSADIIRAGETLIYFGLAPLPADKQSVVLPTNLTPLQVSTPSCQHKY